MGSCIICGTSVDGRVCDIHQEDVVFEFTGTAPNQLTANRYYRGTVDGYAEFGIFVDIGEHVTGLLHRSELDRRLESIDLEPGDPVFVQVKGVRDNGNIDLGWSIRQDKSRFRGVLIDDPDGGERLPEDESSASTGDAGDDGSAVIKQRASATPEGGPDTTTSADAEQTSSAPAPAGGNVESEDSGRGTASESAGSDGASGQSGDDQPTGTTASPTAATVTELEDAVGSLVRLEGEIETARQTSGPTVFTLRDETGSVECAAFEEAGVRAYPDVEEGDIVRIEGTVERRRGDIQVETEGLVILEDEERESVSERMHEALLQRARPESVEALVEDPVVEALETATRDVATAIRRAVIEGRPIVVRHAATADGYLAGAAIERATLPLIREEHTGHDAEYHHFERRPIEGSVYDLNDATRDVTLMLSNRSRHDEPYPLFVFVAAGGTAESLDGFDLLDVYGARRVVIDERAIDEGVETAVDVLLSPSVAGMGTTEAAAVEVAEATATVLAATVAATVNPDVIEDIAHLPAVSFWEDLPQRYADLATQQGYDREAVETVREAVALEAYYHSYEDKRELIDDLLFAEAAADPLGLAEQVSEQYRTRMDRAIETATANLERREEAGEVVLVLDTDAYVHRFEFPPEQLLLDELFRRHRSEAVALVGIGRDQAYVRTGQPLDVRELVELARESAPAAALDARGARDGRIEFLAGEREVVSEAVLESLFAVLSSPQTA